MSFLVDQQFTEQYSSTLDLLVQQFPSKLRGTVMEGSHAGEGASPVNQEGPIEALTPSGRGAPMGRIDARQDRRWIYPIDKEVPQLVYSFDELRVFHDPMSQKMRNSMAAINREYDREILRQFYGSNRVGKRGGTSRAFTSDNIIAAGGSALTVSKLTQALEKLEAADVDMDMEEVYCVLNARQKRALLDDASSSGIKILSSDFVNGRPLVTGKLDPFLGIRFVESQRVTEFRDGANDRIPVYAKSGMYVGFWKDMRSKVSQRDDLSGTPWQAYSCATFGATRLQEPLCVQINCTFA